MKTKEKLAEQYAEEQNSAYTNDYYGFLVGYEKAEELFKPKWISVKEQIPDDERNVIIKIFDYRRPKENVTEVGLGYFDHEEKEWYHTSDVLVNGGHGWMITHYIEIPQ